MPIVKNSETINVAYCDICSSNDYPHQCSGCKRLLCQNCQISWNYYDDEPYCNKCWSIGEVYREQIEECEQTMYDLKEAWDVKCSM